MTPSDTLEDRFDKELAELRKAYGELPGHHAQPNFEQDLLNFIEEEISKAKQEERDRILDGIPCEEIEPDIISVKPIGRPVLRKGAIRGYNDHVHEIQTFINSERTN